MLNSQKLKGDHFISLNKDFFGFMASMACAIHCALLPFILTIGALSSLAWLEHPMIEAGFILLSLILAGWSIVIGYLRHHKNYTALITVLVGFALIIASRFFEGSMEAILTTLGGLTIAAAHIINWRLLRQHKTDPAHYH